MRLWALQIIDEDAKALLFKRRSARWGVKAELGDDGHAPEQVRLLKRTVELLASSGILPLDTVTAYLRLAANDIEKLSGLPEFYLTNKAPVIHFAKLKASLSSLPKVSQKSAVVLHLNKGR